MFISKAEKEKLQSNFEYIKNSYDTQSQNLSAQNKVILNLLQTVKNLSARIYKLESKDAKKNTHKSKWTPELRKRQSENMKKQWAAKKAAKSPANTVVGVPV